MNRGLFFEVRRGLLVGSCLLLGACKGPATPTPPPPPPTLIATCPANQAAVSHFGQPATVTWPDPTSEGAIPPVSYFCVPASGTPFAAGTTPVTCTALDGYNRRATCAFQVSVTTVPSLAVTRFTAFGDSLTEGKQALSARSMILFVFPGAYPEKLQQMLSARYTDQTFTVANEGLSGEKTADGVLRLPGVLASDNPEVLLLQEGANDLSSGKAEAIPDILSSLDTMIRTSQARGVRVLLANQPPQIEGSLRGGGGAPYVSTLNRELATLAQRDGLTLVDVFTPLNAAPGVNIGPDGLHLTSQGYEVMAQAFFGAIRTALETHAFR